jgi:hypothetical protein
MNERPDLSPAGLAAADERAAGTPGDAAPAAIDDARRVDPGAIVSPEEEELLTEVEVIDALPVVSPRRELTRSGAALPAVQTAAAAATGFMVGAATLALLRRRDSRRLTRELRDLRGRVDPARRTAEPALDPGQSYLVHVRVFSRPPQDPRGR